MDIVKRLVVFVLVVLGCAVLAMAAWHKWVERPPAGVPVIQVTPEISLQPVAVLTSFNPEYVYSSTPLRKKFFEAGIWGYVPPDLEKWLTWLKPGIGWTERHSVGTQGITIVYRFRYPSEWDTTKSFEDVSDALCDAMNDAHMGFSGVSYGEQWITNGMPVDFNRSSPFNDPKMRRVTVTLLRVPVYLPEVKFGLIDWGKAVTQENPVRFYSLKNPYYQVVAPIAQPADALPVTRTDGGEDKLEVTMRAFVSGTIMAELKSQQRPSMDKKISNVFSSLVSAAGNEKAKSDGFFPDELIEESGVIPASLFPVETREHKKKSVAVIEIKQPGEETPEWDFDHCSVNYGDKNFPFWYNRNARSNGRQIFMYMTGDVSVLPQPLAVTVQLKRARNFPRDEEQTVEFPLPKGNAEVAMKKTLQLWNGIHGLEKLSCGPILEKEERHLTDTGRDSDCLGLYHNNLNLRSTELSSLKLTLVGSNRKSVEPKLVGNSSVSSAQSNAVNFYSLRLTEDHRLYDYDSFTTAVITVRSARPTLRSFEFIVSPEKAAGLPVN